LDRLVYGRVPAHLDPWPEALAFAVGALAHESQHVAGERDEARAECFGVQAIDEVVQAMGMSGYEGRYLASLYWRTYYARGDPQYRSTECREGGSLDLQPDTTIWP
jgi:hypothetical protein